MLMVMKIKKGSYESVAPITNVIDIDGDRVHYWMKPMMPLLNFSPTNQLYVENGNKEDKTDVKSVNSIDLVVGGNHGQE
jgi:hypothetical protein